VVCVRLLMRGGIKIHVYVHGKMVLLSTNACPAERVMAEVVLCQCSVNLHVYITGKRWKSMSWQVNRTD
jgi:hypothetical protein